MKILIAVFFLTITFAPLLTAAQNTNPTYVESTSQLLVPSIDSLSQPGAFQDGVFEYMPNGHWRLVSHRPGTKIHNIEKVELIKTAAFPVQVFLKITGMFTNGCLAMGQISTRKVNNTFEVFLYYDNRFIPLPEAPVSCTANVTFFSKITPLPVYDLRSGDYSYVVNGSFTGTFSLSSDNSL